jgi:flagellar biosynthesis protein FlhF
MTRQSPDAARIKSYFAASVDGAITQARAELGDEALLLNTRKLTGENGQAAGYEVVFGLPGAQIPVTPPAARAQGRDVRPLFGDLSAARPDPAKRVIQNPVPTAQPKQAEIPAARVTRTETVAARAAVSPAKTPAPDDIADELGKLHAQIDEIRSLLVKSAAPQIAIGRTVPELADVYSRLMAAGVDSAIAKDIVDRLEASMATDAFFMRAGDGSRGAANRWKALRFDPVRLEAFVLSEMGARVPLAPTLGADSDRGAVVVMVGPTGAGKTTSIMKLAASDHVAGRRVRILSLDPSRPGQNHLQSFASNLGIAFSPVQSVHALPAMIAQSAEKELVFVDTPGYANTGDRAAELAALVIQKIPAEVHLVAPGYMKGNDLRRCIQKYEVFAPSRILVTKLDETDTFGSVFSEAARVGLALSFLANGTAIPEDIRPAATEDLLSLALDREAAANPKGAAQAAQCA